MCRAGLSSKYKSQVIILLHRRLIKTIQINAIIYLYFPKNIVVEYTLYLSEFNLLLT